MKLRRFAGLALLCGPLLGHPAAGQTAAPNAGLASAVAAAEQPYEAALALSSRLYSGPEYIDYSRPYHLKIGHQFFEAPTPQPGAVHYNGRYFPGLLLAYDVVRDQVVLSPPRSPLSLRLVSDNVRSFSVAGHTFVRLVADSASQRVIQTGFYEVLLDTTVQVLARRSKRMQEHIVQRSIEVEFIAQDQLLVRKAGVYYPVSRKAALLRAFADRSKEVQEYIKANQLSFKKALLAASVAQVAVYYAELPPR